MTERQAIFWIKDNLGPLIVKAIAGRPGVIYTEDWLAAMAYRETGILILRYQGKPLNIIAPLMQGDYGQRPGENENIYHGFGFWQIDKDSFPDFVKSGDWKDAFKSCVNVIKILEEKRIYLQAHFPALTGDEINRAITASYNCGQGNELKALEEGKDVDVYTFNHDYSAEVWRFREIYKSFTNGDSNNIGSSNNSNTISDALVK